MNDLGFWNRLIRFSVVTAVLMGFASLIAFGAGAAWGSSDMGAALAIAAMLSIAYAVIDWTGA